MNNSAPSRALEESLYDADKYKYVISDEGLKTIKDREFNSESDSELVCLITGEEFENGEIICELPCKHIFKKDAIHRWLKEESATCPCCRHEFDNKEVKKDDSELEIPRMSATEYYDRMIERLEEEQLREAMHRSYMEYNNTD